MSDQGEYWQRWVGSTVEPQHHIKRHAKVSVRSDGRAWIIYADEIRGESVVVEMPHDALTKTCDRGHHDHCPHRLGAPQEGGALLKLSRPSFVWRCGCPCHRDPHTAGRLF